MQEDTITLRALSNHYRYCLQCVQRVVVDVIITDPGVMDFGSVVVNSIAELNLSIKNHTSNHISLKMKVLYVAIATNTLHTQIYSWLAVL